MSPEQILGGHLTGASDIYALGIILFEMLAGRPPFVARKVPQLMKMHLQSKPPSLAALVHEPLPEALVELVSDCLQKVPSRRPESAREVQDRLAEILRSLSDVDISGRFVVGAKGDLQPRIEAPTRPVDERLTAMRLSEALTRAQLEDEIAETQAGGEILAQGLPLGEQYSATRVSRRPGFTEVEAVDVSTDPPIPVLIRRAESPEEDAVAAARLESERAFELLRRFRHERISAMRDFVIQDNSVIVVTERPTGRRLDRYFGRGTQLDVEDAVDLAIQMCTALEGSARARRAAPRSAPRDDPRREHRRSGGQRSRDLAARRDGLPAAA